MVGCIVRLGSFLLYYGGHLGSRFSVLGWYELLVGEGESFGILLTYKRLMEHEVMKPKRITSR
jgi:hypothetical protein